jgi:hypothetical protein
VVDPQDRADLLAATTFATRAAAEAALFRYMTAGFNQRRIQAGLEGLSPDEHEHAWKASRPHPNRLPSNQTPPIPDSKVSGKSGEL